MDDNGYAPIHTVVNTVHGLQVEIHCGMGEFVCTLNIAAITDLVFLL